MRTDVELGDRRMLFDSDNFLSGLRSIADTSSVRLGGRGIPLHRAPCTIGSYVHRTLDGILDTGVGLKVLTEEDADFAELRHFHNGVHVSLTAGLGHYAGDRIETRTFGPFPFPPETIDTRHSNAYVYADMKMSKRVTVTAGIGHDDFRDGAWNAIR